MDDDESMIYCTTFATEMATRLMQTGHDRGTVVFGLLSAASRLTAGEIGAECQFPELLSDLADQCLEWSDRVNAENN